MYLTSNKMTILPTIMEEEEWFLVPFI